MRFQKRRIEFANPAELGRAGPRLVLPSRCISSTMRPNFGRGGGRFPLGPNLEIPARFQEHRHQLPRLARPDARQQRQQPPAGHHVARIFGQPQEGQQIFDVGRFDEFQPAVFVEGNIAPGQFGFEQHAVVRRPEQHGLPPQIDARLAMLENLPDDVFGLIVLRLRS